MKVCGKKEVNEKLLKHHLRRGFQPAAGKTANNDFWPGFE
jgi:hypothetical protein